LIILTRNFRLF